MTCENRVRFTDHEKSVYTAGALIEYGIDDSWHPALVVTGEIIHGKLRDGIRAEMLCDHHPCQRKGSHFHVGPGNMRPATQDPTGH